jgi:hypothetical protein
MAKFKYEYDPLNRILYKKHFGVFSLKDIFNSWDHAIENKLIPPDVSGFVLDYDEAYFDIDLRQSTEIPAYFQKHPAVFGNKKFAVITNTPRDIVIPVIIESMPKGYVLKAFSTREAARWWVAGGVPVEIPTKQAGRRRKAGKRVLADMPCKE